MTEQARDLHELAATMFAEVLRDGQSARNVPAADAEALRTSLRASGRQARVRLRTAVVGEAVVVARLDAELWRDDRATMRAKLTPPA